VSHRVGPKGQVVIPAALRKAIHLVPGDEVTSHSVDGMDTSWLVVGAGAR
jgi:AbrB family looped-hinge helix DNA binding protein